MAEEQTPTATTQTAPAIDVRAVVRDVIQEFVQTQQQKAEPAYKAELLEERRKREQLESRLSEMEESNRRARAERDEMERQTAIRGELQRLGVAKADLAFKAVQSDLTRQADGRITAKHGGDELEMRDYLSKFVAENPELLPARISGGSGATPQRTAGTGGIDIERIKPGMSEDELARIRAEIVRVSGMKI